MFGRRHHPGRRAVSPIFILLRLILSLTMLMLLLGGAYSAYKHFSGFDPLKLDPKSAIVNFLEGKIPDEGLVLISSVKVPDQLGKVLGKSQSKSGQESLQNMTVADSKTEKEVLKFLLIADSHSDNKNLAKVIVQVKQLHPDIQFIIGLGDYTEVGTKKELEDAKREFDLSSLRYFLLVGDHDLWDSRDKGFSPVANFRQTFGPTYQSFITKDFKFLLLYNSDNYSGMSEEQLKWLDSELERAGEQKIKGIFVFVHEPLYHPSSDHFMGRVSKELKDQARSLAQRLKRAGVKKVFAGDTHFFSQYEDPETKLAMVTVGAVATVRNPQAPRFAVVTVYEDGSSRVDDIEIK